jgi:hypothetical protein
MKYRKIYIKLSFINETLVAGGVKVCCLWFSIYCLWLSHVVSLGAAAFGVLRLPDS